MHLGNIASDASQKLDLFAESSFQLSRDGPTGEAPLLSPKYGEWDNGAMVFPLYDNFNSTTLSSQWDFLHSNNVAYQVSDGLDLSSMAAPEDGGITSVSDFVGAYWAEIDLRGFTQNSGNPSVFVALSTEAANWDSGGPASSYETAVNAYNTSFPVLAYVNSMGYSNYTGENISYQLPPGVVGVAWAATGRELAEVNSTVFGSSNSVVSFGPVYVQIGISGASHSVTSTNIEWARLRAFPPNGVMPTIFVTGTLFVPVVHGATTCPEFSSSTPLFGGQCIAIGAALIASIIVNVVLAVVLAITQKRRKSPPAPEPSGGQPG